jgi:hypothetical protein
MIMHCEIYDEAARKVLGWINAEPQCGEDFCDACGDCLACFGDGFCPDWGSHQWVKYVKSPDEAVAIAERYGADIEYPRADEGGCAQ